MIHKTDSILDCTKVAGLPLLKKFLGLYQPIDKAYMVGKQDIAENALRPADEKGLCETVITAFLTATKVTPIMNNVDTTLQYDVGKVIHYFRVDEDGETRHCHKIFERPPGMYVGPPEYSLPN